MIRLESVVKPTVTHRTRWVVLTIGDQRHLLTADEAVTLADRLHDQAEEIA